MIEQTDFDHDDRWFPSNDTRRDPRKRKVPHHVDRGSTDVLLALAGFDPAKIPRKLHAAALRIAWCFGSGLYHPVLIGKAAGLSRKTVARALMAMRGTSPPEAARAARVRRPGRAG